MKNFDKAAWAKLKPKLEAALDAEGIKQGYCFKVNRVNALHARRGNTTFKVDIFRVPQSNT
ncbi:MAG: hypothetical protein QM489_00490 [Candidatus Izemoplasma sp.]